MQQKKELIKVEWENKALSLEEEEALISVFS